jgi:DNA-binding response OmpR family regulator
MAIILLYQTQEMKTENDGSPGKRILLVEDESSLRQTLKAAIARQDRIVVEANNGAEAFGLFATRHFDLVVTDCVMPFVSGDELAVRIRRLAPWLPILMITGVVSRRGPKNPVNAILQKPFDYWVLEQEIIKLLSIPSNETELKPQN